MGALETKWLLFSVISLLIVIQENFAQYVPPAPSVEPLYPKGLRMSIPHEDGITLVAYHAKFNEDFNGLEAGTIARDIVKVRNGRWTYEDRTTRLKRGDIIYYWIHVVYDGLGYNLIDKSYVVNDFYNFDGTPVTSSSTSPVGPTPCTKMSDTTTYDKEGIRHDVCSGQLIFEENFDTFNRDRWTIVERFSGSPHYEYVVYMDSDDTVQVKDGALLLKPIFTDHKYGEGFSRTGSLVLSKCTGTTGTSSCKRTAFGSYILPPIISGRVNTKSSFTFVYGRVEVRAKLPRGDWVFPLITLETRDKYLENLTYCDLIIAHANGNPSLRAPDGNEFGGRILIAGALASVQGQSNTEHLPMKVSNEALWSSDYHTYELEWRSGEVSVKVDGVQYGVQRIPALYDRPVYINFGVAVGGQILFPDSSISGSHRKPWRNVGSKAQFHFASAENEWVQSWKAGDPGLRVDYVKVWAL